MKLSDRLIERTGHLPRAGSQVAELRAASGVGRSTEWQRIRALPRRVLDLSKVPDLTPIWRIEGACDGCDLCRDAYDRRRPVSLRPLQSAALLEAAQCGGLYAPIRVGGGKELISLLLADAVGAKRAALLTKARLRDQLLRVDVPRYGRHFRLPMDRVTVITYHELSDADLGDALERLCPDWVIANEAHCVARRGQGSGRARKFDRFFDDHPNVPLVAMSGSFLRSSIRDSAQFLERCLGSRSPVPIGWREREDWAAALDSQVERPMAPGALLDLCGEDVGRLELARATAWSPAAGPEEVRRSAARRVYRARLRETPGVIAHDETEIGVSLEIAARRPPVPAEVLDLLREVRRLWRLGDQELQDAKDVAMVCRQLACGFYYRWRWPSGRDEEWLAARGAWSRELRDRLSRSGRAPLTWECACGWEGRSAELLRGAGLEVACPGCRAPGVKSLGPIDTPEQLVREIERGAEDCPEWVAWRALRGRYAGGHPPVEAVRVSDFCVRDALAWAATCGPKAGGIVWYEHREVGRWLGELGLPVYGEGAQGDRILDARPEREPCIAASRSVHSDGKNLQAYRRNLVLVPPAGVDLWEQLLGRTHRDGQEADEVECEVCQHDRSLRSAFAHALEGARFLAEADQIPKLLQATRIGFDGARP